MFSNMKLLIKIAIISTFSLSLSIASATCYAEENTGYSDIEETLQQMYHETVTSKQNTLESPLLIADTQNQILRTPGQTIFGAPFETGTKGNLLYQQIGRSAFRIQYYQIDEEASVFWRFEKPMDFRNRWFRMHYTGPIVPSHAYLVIDSDKIRNDGKFDVYFENTLTSRFVYFKLPDRMPYSNVKSIRLVMDPDAMETPHADFVILNLMLLPQDEDPLTKPADSDLSRFDWYTNPFSPENQIISNADKIR